ncbi:collagen alpha-1(I) chain-like [Canis lupus familiaris]|uniref:collagen alpha-1(I) chain-like n=1 Tax=Canis lupus familiaris TaxID=9615 RepID=UPI0018F6F3E2|nr:collagen alpha-1(I) chain-like [Canis lupus familiaris]
MLTTIPPTLHSPGRPRTPAQAPHQRLLALSPPPPPPAAALPRRAGRPQLCAVAGATSGRPAPHPRHPHAALAAPQARPPAASAARLWGALSPPCGSRPGSRAAVRRVSEEPVAASLPSGGPGWAGPSPHAPGRQGARADEEGQGVRGVGSTAGRTGPPRSPRASGRTGPGGGTREEKEDKEEKEEKEGPGGRRTFGQRGGGARDQKRACLASPSGNRTPVSRVTGGDTHHYTNEDGGGGRPGARPLSARPPARRPACLPTPHPGPRRPARPSCQAPATCPGPRPTRPDPPGRRVSAHSSPPARLGASRPRTRRRPRPRPAARGWRREKTPDTASRAARASRRPRAGDGPRRAAGAAGGRTPAAGCAPREGGGGGGEDRGEGGGASRVSRRAVGLVDRDASPVRPSVRPSVAHPHGRQPAPGSAPGPSQASGGAPRPAVRMAERSKALRSAPPYTSPRPPAGSAGSPRPVLSAGPHSFRGLHPLRPRGAHEAWPPGGLTTATRPPGGQPSPPRASQRRDPPPRSLGLARGGGVGSTPPWWLRGALSARQPCLPGPPSAPEAAAGPGLQDASALPHRAARQPASRRPLRPSAPAGLTPHRSPAGPDGELRAELTRLSLASWLGRYSAAPISDDDTDADTHTRAPTPPPHPAAPRERTQSELRAPAGPRRRALHGPESHPPMGLRGGAGREGKVRAELRRPQTPRAAWESGAGQAWPGCSSRQDSVWRRPRPRERAQGEPSPPRGLAGTVGAARRPEPEPEPEPEPSAHLHGRGACLADRGPAARPRAAGAHHWPCRDDDERRWGSRLVAAATALAATLHPAARPLPPDVAQPRDALYGHLAAVSFKHGPLPTAKVTASTRSMQPSQHRRQHTQPRGTAPPPRLSPARRVHERRRTSMGITAKGTEVTSPPRPASTTPAALGPPPTPRTTIPTPAPAPAPAPGLPPPCQKQLYQQQQQQQQQQQRDVPTASRPA